TSSAASDVYKRQLSGYQGNVAVMNHSLKHLPEDYYEKIGVDFEFPNFYGKFTALENLTYFSSLYKHCLLYTSDAADEVG
ncbi:ABC transporter ATP-binding protein, partial [Enterococcus sp. S181_ASV_20]|nr:ABC transporter ATP-binding protein [Enterococcus sp. S181_ASV_20]